MADFPMPSLGADMEDGELVEWLKRPGDTIARGDVIAVVETQKGAIEIEAYEGGVLETILVEPGNRVPVGTPLARIAGEGERDDASRVAEPSVTADSAEASARDGTTVAERDVEHGAERDVEHGAERSVERPARAPSPTEPPVATGCRHVSPLARRRAASAGVDIGSIVGSGDGGAVLASDVEAAIDAAAVARVGAARSAATPGARATSAATGTAATEESGSKGGSTGGRKSRPERVSTTGLPAGMREAIAAAMSRSKREIPHYYLAHSIDLAATEAWLAELNAPRPPAERVLLGALLIGAVARAARAHPAFNGHYLDGRFQPSDAVHVGTAIRLRGGGLVAPAVHDADRLDADALMVRLRDLIERVRAGRFRASELTDPTLTLSSVGERGVATLYGVIHPPQVCLVGFGAPQETVGVRDGRPVVQRRLSVTLAADHRVSDGHAGSRFLMAIAKHLTSAPAWTHETASPIAEPQPPEEVSA